MTRMPLYVLPLALALASLAVRAEPQGCVQVPRGVPMDMLVTVPVPGMPRARAEMLIPGVPSHGHDCLAVMPPAADILRGPPAADILRGPAAADLLNGPASPDILRGDPPPPRGRVIIQPR